MKILAVLLSALLVAASPFARAADIVAPGISKQDLLAEGVSLSDLMGVGFTSINGQALGNNGFGNGNGNANAYRGTETVAQIYERFPLVFGDFLCQDYVPATDAPRSAFCCRYNTQNHGRPWAGANNWTPAAKADQVQCWPGLRDRLVGRTASGILGPIDGHINLHYYYTEAFSNPTNAPVYFWFQGGPHGSMGQSYFGANGPLRPMPNNNQVEQVGDVLVNPNAYANVAHHVAIDFLFGTGFSYSTDPVLSKIRHDDDSAAATALKGLQEFFNRFPHLRGNKVIIGGSSYAGHTIPQVAKEIVLSNEAGNPHINLDTHGIFAGNPLIDNFSTRVIQIRKYAAEGAIPDELVAQVEEVCFKPFEAAYKDGTFDPYSPTAPWKAGTPCKPVIDAANARAGANGFVNAHPGIEVCSNQQKAREVAEYAALVAAGQLRLSPSERDLEKFYIPACWSSNFVEYLNRADVQAALHVSVEPLDPVIVADANGVKKYLPNSNGQWAAAGRAFNPVHNLDRSAVPEMRFLIEKGHVITIYSGDQDSQVSYQTTQYLLRNGMNLTPTTPAAAWKRLDHPDQTGGLVTKYPGIEHYSVRGGGHNANFNSPVLGLQVFKMLLTRMGISV